MMGVPIYGPPYIYGDKISVIHNTRRHESTFKKKNNYIFYHAVCESIAMGESLAEPIGVDENCAELITKV